MNTKEQNQALIRELLKKDAYDFNDLCCIVSVLRGEGGCPWDMEQNHHSIRSGMIEECYEVIEAIDRDDAVLLREELGDVLLQIVFHADIEKDAGRFDINDVAHDECIKMIHRHPHVFGALQVDTSEQVLKNWEVIKSEEKQRVSLSDQLQAIPPMLPALMRASKVIKKSGYNEEHSKEETVKEAADLLQEMACTENEAQAKNIAGELLLRAVSLCRAAGVDAEEALSAKINDMIARVSK